MKIENTILSILVSSGLILLVFELVRRRKLNEEYSWLWMLTGSILLGLSVFPGILFFIAHILGISVPANVLFFFGVMFLMLIVLHFSTAISKLSNNIKTLTQKLAILEKDIKKSEKS